MQQTLDASHIHYKAVEDAAGPRAGIGGDDPGLGYDDRDHMDQRLRK
ncbi:hypothetical protein ACWZEH_33805 [Streptomyces sp. QTS137]